MDFTKPPLSLQQQVDRLKHRGLLIDDEQQAVRYLSNISYYRLRAYTYPFQNNQEPQADHRFIQNDICFSDIIDLYCFDRRLRSLMFNAIEKIEVAVRTKMIQIYGDSTQSGYWFERADFYQNLTNSHLNKDEIPAFDLLMKDIENEIKRSNEDFIKHYQNKYDHPALPPAWMTLEVLSLGTLSRMYKILKKSPEKKAIAKAFGLNDDRVFANWIHAIAIWRNCCAHHSRVWNRRSIIHIQMPTHADYPFLDKHLLKSIHDNKIFAVLCCIKYISNIISPDSDLKKNILSIMNEGGRLLNLRDMGFPADWERSAVWNV